MCSVRMQQDHLCMLCLLSLASSCSAFGYQRLCGTQLVEALLFICGERGLFYQPGQREDLLEIQEGDREKKSTARITKRGIVEQCCNFCCNYYDLENYCNT